MKLHCIVLTVLHVFYTMYARVQILLFLGPQGYPCAPRIEQQQWQHADGKHWAPTVHVCRALSRNGLVTERKAGDRTLQ